MSHEWWWWVIVIIVNDRLVVVRLGYAGGVRVGADAVDGDGWK